MPACHQGRETLAEARVAGAGATGRVAAFKQCTRYCCDGSENTSQRMKAQTLDNDYGKILRIRDDGSIPSDNPFVGRSGCSFRRPG